MKKVLICWAMVGLVCSGVMAAEKVRWPVWFAFNDSENIDVIGLRFNLPSGYCEQVTGIDLLGFIGRSRYFNGIQLNLLRNDVKDTLAGIQIGCYNSVGFCDMIGTQIGLWNEAKTFYGFQVGLVNLADYSKGFQVGLINRVEGISGYQVGAINVIRDGTIPFCPFVNVGF